MPIAKTHYIGLPTLAYLVTYLSAHQNDILAQFATAATAVLTFISYAISQYNAIKASAPTTGKINLTIADIQNQINQLRNKLNK